MAMLKRSDTTVKPNTLLWGTGEIKFGGKNCKYKTSSARQEISVPRTNPNFVIFNRARQIIRLRSAEKEEEIKEEQAR